MKTPWVLLVSSLVTVLAVYLHEHHLSTLMSLLRTSSHANSVVINAHNGILSLFGYKIAKTTQDKNNTKKNSKTILFSTDDLKKFSGERGLYVSILGKVYDVGRENPHYQPGETYHLFTGRDASRAFITGDFTEKGLISEVLDLSSEELKSLSGWAKFYKKRYKYKGKLIGLYYEPDGEPTWYLQEVRNKIKQAEAKAADSDNIKQQYPPCNVEWNRETGSRVWCSTKSGGIERDWVGSPRMFYEPGASSYRCACVNLNVDPGVAMAGKFREYEGCNPLATSCRVNG